MNIRNKITEKLKQKKNRKNKVGKRSFSERRKIRRTPRAFVHLIKSFVRKMTRDKLDVYSAQSAFYLVMATIPIIMLMLMFLKYTPLTEAMILEALQAVLDERLMGSVEVVVGNLYHGSLTVGSIASISMLWVASKGIIGIANGLNSIHNIRENRNFIILRLRAMIYTIVFVFALIVAFGLLVAGLRFRDYLIDIVPFLSGNSTTGTRIAFMLFAIAVLIMIIDCLYVFLPNRKTAFTSQIFGAGFTVIAWMVYTFFFMIYLKLAKNLSIVYGGLVTMMVTMLWLYFCLYLFFFGAEINAWRENPDSFPF